LKSSLLFSPESINKALAQKPSEARGRVDAEPVEDHEVLHLRAIVRELSDSVEHQIEHLLPDCVVGVCAVIRRVLLPGDDLLRMEQRAACSAPTSSTAVGSRFMNTARGTCMPVLTSKKKRLNASSLTPISSLDRICLSAHLAGCHA
jgi:hypothetical protein